MNGLQNDVREFMLKAEQNCPTSPTMPSIAVRKLRVKLIAEELLELCFAFGLDLEITEQGIKIESRRNDPSIVDAYDAVLDLTVVTLGVGVAMGADLEPGWREVHRSNMTKFIDGHRRSDGKWVKGPSYSPANLQPILEAQQA